MQLECMEGGVRREREKDTREREREMATREKERGVMGVFVSSSHQEMLEPCSGTKAAIN